jgi:hypothetical protein
MNKTVMRKTWKKGDERVFEIVFKLGLGGLFCYNQGWARWKNRYIKR